MEIIFIFLTFETNVTEKFKSCVFFIRTKVMLLTLKKKNCSCAHTYMYWWLMLISKWVIITIEDFSGSTHDFITKGKCLFFFIKPNSHSF